MEAIWYMWSYIQKPASLFYYENLKFKIFDVAFLFLLSVFFFFLLILRVKTTIILRVKYLLFCWLFHMFAHNKQKKVSRVFVCLIRLRRGHLLNYDILCPRNRYVWADDKRMNIFDLIKFYFTVQRVFRSRHVDRLSLTLTPTFTLPCRCRC